MSYADICDTILAYQEQQKGRLQQRANMDYALVSLIRVAIHDPNKMPLPLKKAYPGLFEAQEAPSDWKIIKANMKAFQAAHNRRQRKAGEKT